MKEYFFVIYDRRADTHEFIRVIASDTSIAKDKFAAVFCPYLKFSYEDIEIMLEGQDVKLYCNEINYITKLI